MNVKKFLLDFEFPNVFLLKFFNLLKWKLVDFYRFFHHKLDLHLYGVYCITGLYGCGKTVSMTYLANEYRNKYKDKILICTNFGFKNQDFPFISLRQLNYQYDRPIIYFFDEVQNIFPSSNRDFNPLVLEALTLNRKGHGKRVYWASQDHELVHKSFRRLTLKFGLVKTIFGRFTSLRWFNAIDYQRYFEQINYKKRLQLRASKRISFVQTDYLRSLYNSYGWDNGERVGDFETNLGEQYIIKK